MQRRAFLASAATAAAIAGCTGGTDADDRAQNDQDEQTDDPTTAQNAETTTAADTTTESDLPPGSTEDVALRSAEFYQEEYSAGVKGIIENVSGEVVEYAAVNVAFLDEDDVQIGQGLDNVSDLASGRKYRYDAMFLSGDESELASYEVWVESNNY